MESVRAYDQTVYRVECTWIGIDKNMPWFEDTYSTESLKQILVNKRAIRIIVQRPLHQNSFPVIIHTPSHGHGNSASSEVIGENSLRALPMSSVTPPKITLPRRHS